MSTKHTPGPCPFCGSNRTRGPEPKKFDEALSWRENDELARRMAQEAIQKAEGTPQ